MKWLNSCSIGVELLDESVALKNLKYSILTKIPKISKWIRIVEISGNFGCKIKLGIPREVVFLNSRISGKSGVPSVAENFRLVSPEFSIGRKAPIITPFIARSRNTVRNNASERPVRRFVSLFEKSHDLRKFHWSFGSSPWPGTLSSVPGQDTSLSQGLSPPRYINRYRRI